MTGENCARSPAGQRRRRVENYSMRPSYGSRGRHPLQTRGSSLGVSDQLEREGKTDFFKCAKYFCSYCRRRLETLPWSLYLSAVLLVTLRVHILF